MSSKKREKYNSKQKIVLLLYKYKGPSKHIEK